MQIHFDTPKKMQLDIIQPLNCASVGRGNHTMQQHLKSYSNHATHRSTTKQPESYIGGFSSAIGAVIAPISDFLKPTKKDEFTDCKKYIFTTGPKSIVPLNPVFEPTKQGGGANTTVKETTMHGVDFNINGMTNGIYVDNYYPTNKNVQRDNLSREYIGTANAAYASHGAYSILDGNQITECIDKTPTLYSRPNPGNMSVFDGNIGATILKPDSACGDPYFGAANSVIKIPATLDNYGELSKKLGADAPGSAERNKQFVVEQYLKNPFTPYPHSLTFSV
jgi:hypothetical protein